MSGKKIEWDEAKRARTLAERNLDFSDAEIVFAGDYVEMPDDRRDYGEERFIVYAALNDRPICMVWTPRGDARRIISMRHVHEQEFKARKGALD